MLVGLHTFFGVFSLGKRLLNNPASVSLLSGVGNRKSVFKETAIPVAETFIVNPLECNHAPFGVNTFKGGHDNDQVSRNSQT